MRDDNRVCCWIKASFVLDMTQKNKVAVVPCEDVDNRMLSPQPKNMGLKKRFMSMLGFANEDQSHCAELQFNVCNNFDLCDFSTHVLQYAHLQEARLQAEARDNFSASWTVLNCNTGWKKEKETANGDLVESKGVAKQRKIFRLKVNT